uniref:CAAX prenyl protease 2 n=1 Tax=Chelydra serpentina TaxID=8475 RepID=A0A8C3SN40_CHESE
CQVLFLGPLIQLSMDCPWDWVDGLKVMFDPRFWTLCLSDMRWLRNQVIAPLTEELVFRACMLPMLIPCTGQGPAIFTCPLFFGVAHFHHVIEQLRFRQGSIASIFLSAGRKWLPGRWRVPSLIPTPGLPPMMCACTTGVEMQPSLGRGICIAPLYWRLLGQKHNESSASWL